MKRLIPSFVYQLLVAGSIILVVLLLPVYATAQDSINRSRNFLIDTTSLPEPPPAIDEDEYEYEDEEYDEDEQVIVEPQPERNYFLALDSLRLEEEKRQYQLRATSDSQISKWKRDDDFWYADRSFALKPESMEKERKARKIPFYMTSWFETLLKVLAIGTFVALLVAYLANNHASIFRRNRSIQRVDANSDIPEDIFAISYEKEIQKAEQKDDYRLAIRLRFLQLLRNMADRNIIRYQQERTNLDYLMQLHQTSWYDDFFRLTRHFEYSWYGLFEVRQEQYNRIRTDFENMNRKFH